MSSETVLQESDNRHAPPATVVIFGASGDLTRRKLIPAIESLARHNRLTERFAVVGVARTPMDDEQFIHNVLGERGLSGMPQLAGGIRYIAGGYDDPETYKNLTAVLDELDQRRGTAGNRVFYLSTPAEAFPLVINGLAGAGLNQAAEGAFARLVIEKPYGHDEGSAKQLDQTVHAAFDEAQVFRIDHYLGKDTVQNVLALRFANAIFQPIWDRTWVDHVQITVAETLGVGTRGSFYEHAGAMRDIVQNHVLQVLALALMEPPASFSAEAVRNEKVKLLQAIRLPRGRAIDDIAVRGQYTRGGTREELMAGYREEPGVDPLSRTETYAALRLDVDNWRWAGVPFYVRTGKRLPSRVTEVALQFQRPPHLPIPDSQLTELQPDALILRIQPDEGIALRFGAKVPGHSFRVRSASMDFSYDKTFREESPEAYERLLLDALIGDTTLFIRSDEVEQCWRIVDPIIERWAQDPSPIPTYEAASWGPADANRLIERSGRAWRNTVA
jgi:glucose-6-phosphate 1-dehydrogenase